jgi:hypothetical protein
MNNSVNHSSASFSRFFSTIAVLTPGAVHMQTPIAAKPARVTKNKTWQRTRLQQCATAKVFRVRESQKAIDAACRKLKIERITHHDLRHLFATTCIESAIDIPTVSRWLGHKDGGALAMRTLATLGGNIVLSRRNASASSVRHARLCMSTHAHETDSKPTLPQPTQRLAITPAEFGAVFRKSATWAYRRIYAGEVRVLESFRPMLIPITESTAS